MKKTETVNMISHLAGAVGMTVAASLLIVKTHIYGASLLVVIIYALSTILLFSASALYHFNKKKENEKSIWRTLDHISIYIMIAGTYTPVCFLSMESVWWITILSIQWGLAIFGLCFELFRVTLPRWVTSGIYLLMGWIAIAAIVPIYRGITLNTFVLFMSGGIVYSMGAIIYAIKKPDPFPGILGFHEIFHCLILLANGLFLATIWIICSGR
ncbi:MAG TPA: hemolysin III family protein [Chitinispirillaceae bacterium]|nr:hemolysin III family protein [Chitinispirillaceae bacterium]